MTEHKRFRARYDTDPRLDVGDRLVFLPEHVIETWDTSTGGGHSLVPRPTMGHGRPRPGRVLDIKPPRPQDGRPWWDVIAEDLPARLTSVGAILSVMGPRLMAPPRSVYALLDHLAIRTLMDDRERAAVANAVTPWLRSTFPQLSGALNALPDYESPDLYRAWLDGVTAVTGARLPVPPPPFALVKIQPEPEPLNLSDNLSVRPDAVNRMWGNRNVN